MKHILSTLLLMLYLTVTGCAGNHEKQDLLPADLPDDWATQTTVQELPITTSLLDLLDFPGLEELVQEALDNNPNLQATAIRLQATNFLLSSSRAPLFPSAAAGFDAGHNNQPENHVQPSLQISWELDLWGRLADEHRAATFDYKAQLQEYIHARDALAARLIQSVLHVIASKQILSLEEERLDSLVETEATLIRRYRQGLGTLDELATARTRTEVARADLSSVREEYKRQIRALETLLGRYPRATLALGQKLPMVESPPVHVPARVLTNRADVQVALSRVFSMQNTASATKKAMLPALNISAQASRSAISLNDLSGASTAWSILGSLTQPLFEAGRLRDEAKAATLQTDASLADLHSVILRALQETENAFGREQDLANQQLALGSAVREAELSRVYFEKRYRSGLDSLLSLLITQEQEMSIKRRLLEVRAERLSNRIDLALALGIGAQPQTPPQENSPL